MLDESRFQNCWHRLGGERGGSALWAALVAAYAEPHRFYHTAVHIEDCLQQFDLVRAEADRPEEVEMALWFHDAVYDPRAADNEERSAAWVGQVLKQAGVAAEVIGRVADLVRLTKHDQQPATRDGELLLDVDLSILGQGPADFADYDRRIRQEYAWVPEEQYRESRAAILEGLLRRPAIYRTAFFHKRLEAPARENLARAIADLRGNTKRYRDQGAAS